MRWRRPADFVRNPRFPSIFCDLCARRSMRFYAFSGPTQRRRKSKMRRQSQHLLRSLFDEDGLLLCCRPQKWRSWSKPCCSRSWQRSQAGNSAMTKITSEHLARGAFVYIRQSTGDQLLHNQESQRRQYALADRARQLGWTSVEVIDDEYHLASNYGHLWRCKARGFLTLRWS